jgi:plasmid stability protein
MARMTEEEAWALDDISTTWLRVKAAADHKSVGQIINEIVHEKIAQTSV